MELSRSERRKSIFDFQEDDGSVNKIKKIVGVFLGLLTFFIGLSSNLFLDVFSHKGHSTSVVIQILVAAVAAVLYSLYEKKLNLWVFVKTGIIYIIYLILSYWIAITTHLNSPKWHWEEFAKNNGFQTNYLVPTLVFFGLTLIIALILKKKIEFKRPASGISNFFISQFLVAYCLTDTKMVGFVFFSDFYDKDHIFTSLISFLILFVFYSLLSYSFTLGVTDKLNNRVSIHSATSMSLVLAFLFNFWLQYGIKDDVSVNGYTLFPGATLFQIGILTLLNLLVFLLLNRFLLSTVVIVIASSALALANQLKFASRNDLVLPSDLGWIRQIGLLMSFVEERYIIGGLATVVLIISLYMALRRYIWSEHVLTSWKSRVISLVGIGLLFLGINYGMTANSKGDYPENIPVLSRLNSVSIDWMGNIKNAQTKSLAFVWGKQLTTEVIKKPKNYNRQTMEKLAKKYSSEANQINKTRSQNINDQTVIYVLSESFANPNRLDGVTLSSKSVTPNIDAIKKSTTSGLMKSDGFGGGTANMEFQTLTGLPMYNMSPTVSTIYTEVASNMNYIPSISNWYSKKNKIGVHFESANNYSRDSIYNKMGYSKFYATSGSTDKIPKNKIKDEGLHPSDASTYNFVLEQLDSNSPQFLSVITMQNHMPWSSGLPADITGKGEGFTTKENNDLTSYARLLSATDKSTKDFLAKLDKIDQKITVVFYGDHLPGFYPDSTFKKNPESQYQTDYFIWSNYKTEKYNHPLLNSSDLSAALLETTDSKVSPYYALLTEVMDNASINQKKMTTEQKEIANDLKLVEYDLISGKGYLSKTNFYNVKESNN